MTSPPEPNGDAALLARLQAQLAARGVVLPPGPCGLDRYGDTPEMADALVALIVAGQKRAGTSLLWAHEAEGEPLPAVGQLQLVLDGAERPVALTRVTQVDVLPFDAVDADYAAVEGEGDGSLAYWREVHAAFFARECERLGREPVPSMPVVCCRFDVLQVLPVDTLDPDAAR